MNSAPPEGWRGPGPSQGTQGPGSVDATGQAQGRPFGAFGVSGSLPPPNYHDNQSNHSLSIANLTQGHPPSNQHQYNTQPPPSSQGHPMVTTGHPIPHQSPPYSSLGRERERDYHDARERERERDRDRNMEIQRQEELRERQREESERFHREQQRPVQSHAGPMPLHQPIPSKVQNSILGPNGLLGGTGMLSNGGPAPGIHSQATEPPRPPFVHQPNQPIFGGPSPMPGHAQLPHGQQPILNDALSYLDQVKVRFSDQPDVYNRFLDIMKDFKSQAIDTPGVIDRVSNLFNGHPTLIQGFNTFLPPGYRIECGTGDNPNEIRVTTPSGTMTQSLQGRSERGVFESSNLAQSTMNRPEPFESRHGWNQQLGQQISPGARSATLTGYEQTIQTAAVDRGVEHDSAAVIHQQQERGVSQLQNAVSAATNGTSRAALAGSPGPGQPGPFQHFAPAGGDPKRGPVEFNHAISYVNKIKNRFAQQPEIYKQFLEILQTYQRESKPIQDVYSQVTQLFGSAPDLLEDFKQFLPESAAAAKAQASARAAANDEMMMQAASVRGAGDTGYGAGQIAQAQTPKPAAKMPPMGQFDPPSTSKENKKRRGPGSAMIQGGPLPLDGGLGVQGSRPGAVQVGNANKRQKITAQRQVQPEAPAVSPSLIPQLPEPLPPGSAPQATQDETGLFERIKKHIGNRAIYSEFMKLLNLHSHDLIDKYNLLDRVGAFIGGNTDLMTFFTNWLDIPDQEDPMEARLRPDPGRVNLSHCRSLGPSYRHLPKRDQNRPCKGRDAMCYEVLNDIWASHPTWASEDSGFVAHRKNQYEEALHRIEEERHDYDFHIESCHRTIQLMEPLVQQINVMPEQDRVSFPIDRGLGGASEAIPKRIIMKIYGRDYGAKIMNDLFAKPVHVLPIILRRLKQKLEEWKQVQREWEKIWREQINKQFWKSLDHQGINVKNLDKKNFQQKILVSEIQAKYEEQKKNREKDIPQPKHQLEYVFDFQDVLRNTVQLIRAGLDADRSSYSQTDQKLMRKFLIDFLAEFFGMERESLEQLLSDDRDLAKSNDEIEDEQPNDQRAIPRTKSKVKKSNSLHRSVLDRGNGREDSVASGSKESTPIPTDMDDVDMISDALPESGEVDATPKRWVKLASQPLRSIPPIKFDEVYPHTTPSCYANANIYQFFRLFEMLYCRLVATKINEEHVVEAVARHHDRANGPKPAVDLRMIDKAPEDFFSNTEPTAEYYPQILQMCEDVISGELEMSHLEDTLRRYYNQTGWQLYTVDKLVAAIIRSIFNITGSDPKDKSIEITNLFFKDRGRPDTTRAQEITYRKQVEKFSKDGEVFRISYAPATAECTIRLFPPQDMTFDNDTLSDIDRWQYYGISYAMIHATEGVDQTKMQPAFLRRCIPRQRGKVELAYDEVYGTLQYHDNSEILIRPDIYKMKMKGSWDFCRPSLTTKEGISTKMEESEAFMEKFVRNTTWMKDQSADDVMARKMAWDVAVKEGFEGFEEKLAKAS